MNKALCLSALAASLYCSVIAQAAFSAPEYTPGISFGKADHLARVTSLAIGKDDYLVVASLNKILIYDPSRDQCLRSFEPGFEKISAVAVENGTIYVFSRKTESQDRDFNGRKFKIETPVGALCKKFAWDGSPLGDLDLKDLKDVTNAKVVNGTLYVSDFAGTRKVLSFDATTGRPLASYGKDLRLCCGILDFAVDAKNYDVLIANLGAFKLERYSSQGHLKSSFGQRGENLESFQGCCNPVSAAVLPDGNLVVVEKDPSRVKIYTPEGKMVRSFDNLAELVKGCNQVSVAADSKGRIYFGVNARERFVLQYLPKR